tara:strand:+ start:491 stop:1237 length:747 start_codon:yes stop_codon:yes gene_type:complete
MIYVINLKHRKDRLLSITQQLKYKEYRIIEAIDGIKLYEDLEYREEVSKELDIPLCFFQEEWINSRSNFSTMSNRICYKYKIFSCLLSHIKCLLNAYQDGLPNPIIMEDDAVVEDPDFLDTELPDDYEILNLGAYFNVHEYDLIDHTIPIQRIHIGVNKATPWCLQAYFVRNPKLILDMFMTGFYHGRGKRKAKSMTTEHKIILSSADSWVKNNIYPNCPCYMTSPIKVSQGSFSSDLDHTGKYKFKR